MTSALFHLNQDGSINAMDERPYASEAALQDLIARFPEILAGDQFDADEPRRWLLVAREMPIRDNTDGAGRWSLDHLLLDQDAIPTLVEVKRSSDSRSRREVVGQMLDYAANGSAYWTLADLRSSFEQTCRTVGADPDEALEKLTLDSEKGGDAYWSAVEENLRIGRVRMVFVVDRAASELQRIVNFLGEKLQGAEVFIVEVRQHIGATGSILSSTVSGAASFSSKTQSIRTRQTEGEWIATFTARHGPDCGRTAQLLAEWMQTQGAVFVTKAQNPSLGVKLTTAARPGGVYPLFLKANGKAALQLYYLMNQVSAFAEEGARRQLIATTQAALGIDLSSTHVRGEIGIPIQVLTAPQKFESFRGVLSDLVATIRAEPSG